MPPKDVSQLLIAAGAGVLAGGVIAVALSHVLPCPWPLKSRSKSVYVLAVSLEIKPGTLALFKEHFEPLARHTRSSAEPGCLRCGGPRRSRDFDGAAAAAHTLPPRRSYELSVEEGSNDTKLLIFERYISRADLEGPHVSAAFKKFGRWLNEESGILVAKSRKTYIETNVGHMIR